MKLLGRLFRRRRERKADVVIDCTLGQTGYGKTTVWINGQEIPSVRDVELRSLVRDVVSVTLTILPTKVEVNANGAKVRKITLCPKCNGEVED